MKTHTIKINGREFRLAFTMGAMEQLSELDGFDISNLEEMLKEPKWMIDFITVMAGQGAILDGKKLDVNREWFASRIPFGKAWIVKVATIIAETISDYMMMETEEDDDDEEKDVVLEELKKKDGKTA